eukprot:5464116-Pleurochrysis_carterae.AAC.1
MSWSGEVVCPHGQCAASALPPGSRVECEQRSPDGAMQRTRPPEQRIVARRRQQRQSSALPVL